MGRVLILLAVLWDLNLSMNSFVRKRSLAEYTWKFFFFISLWKSFANSPFCTLAAVGSLNRFPFLMLFISLCPSLTADFPRFNHSCGHRASEAWLYPWAVKQEEQQLEVTTEMLHFVVEIANRQETTKNLSRLSTHLTQISSLIHIYTNINLEDHAAGV